MRRRYAGEGVSSSAVTALCLSLLVTGGALCALLFLLAQQQRPF